MTAADVIDDLRYWLERFPDAKSRVLDREQIDMIVREYDQLTAFLARVSGVRRG